MNDGPTFPSKKLKKLIRWENRFQIFAFVLILALAAFAGLKSLFTNNDEARKEIAPGEFSLQEGGRSDEPSDLEPNLLPLEDEDYPAVTGDTDESRGEETSSQSAEMSDETPSADVIAVHQKRLNAALVEAGFSTAEISEIVPAIEASIQNPSPMGLNLAFVELEEKLKLDETRLQQLNYAVMKSFQPGNDEIVQ